MYKSTIKLFKSIPVTSLSAQNNSKEDILYGIKKRVIFNPSIKIAKYLCDFVHYHYFINGDKVNNAFHKSWNVINDSSQTELVNQAVLHYFTTYGFREMNIDSDFIYIPNEKLEIPELKNNVPFVYIDSITYQELIEKIIQLGSGIALSDDALRDIKELISEFNFDDIDKKFFIKQIKNRELRILFYDSFNIVPEESEEFFKYCIYKLTNETLIIKNRNLIDLIKTSIYSIDDLLLKAPKDLASIFFRYKPLFLAMKSISKNKRFFNQLRRKADKLHKPVPENYMMSITQRILNDNMDHESFLKDMEKSNIFQIIRLINTFEYRLSCKENEITSYQIRNGKIWIDEIKPFCNDRYDNANIILDYLYTELDSRVKNNFKDKIFYIPEGIEYSIPTSEKQFIGNIPFGSNITVNKNMLFGIHWFNNEDRVDLDLSTIDISGKVGWDSYYKRNADILFSGDMTDASDENGASEVFYISKNYNQNLSILVNYFNCSYNKTNFTFFVAESDEMLKLKNNYMVDPNKIKLSVNLDIGEENKIIGLVDKNKEKLSVYFYNTNMGIGISSTDSDLQLQVRKSLIKKMKHQLSLNELIEKCGGKIVDKIPELVYIDLSIEKLSKETLLNLLK